MPVANGRFRRSMKTVLEVLDGVAIADERDPILPGSEPLPLTQPDFGGRLPPQFVNLGPSGGRNGLMPSKQGSTSYQLRYRQKQRTARESALGTAFDT
jgi:hypothetical protein